MQTYKEFDQEFTNTWNEYVVLNEKLNPFRGKELDNKDLPALNELVQEIQDCFKKLYPAINFVRVRHEMCTKALKDYTTFIEHLNKAGATSTQEESEEAPVAEAS